MSWWPRLPLNVTVYGPPFEPVTVMLPGPIPCSASRAAWTLVVFGEPAVPVPEPSSAKLAEADVKYALSAPVSVPR